MRIRRVFTVAGALGVAATLLLAGEVIAARARTYLVTVDFRIDRTVRPDLAAAGTVELRVLGDSTAAGVGADDPDGALPVLLAERVAARMGRAVHVVGLGVSGARTRGVRVDQLPLVDAAADVVVIAVGSNDVIHLTPPPRLASQTRDLLTDAGAEGAPVVLAGIPRFAGVTAFAQPLRALVDGLAAIQRERQRHAAAGVPGATFVDIAALASPRFAGRPDAFASDEFHPSVVGYGFWADALAPAVAAAVTGEAAGASASDGAGRS